jgi:hypothetical protein
MKTNGRNIPGICPLSIGNEALNTVKYTEFLAEIQIYYLFNDSRIGRTANRRNVPFYLKNTGYFA